MHVAQCNASRFVGATNRGARGLKRGYGGICIRFAVAATTPVRHFDAIWDERGCLSFRQYPLFSLLLPFNRPPPRPSPPTSRSFFSRNLLRSLSFVSGKYVKDRCRGYVPTQRYPFLFLSLDVYFSLNV